ncbi:PREDICTED: uncharacterized protein DDB_G0285291-like [Rhagoletis zephyria]|uniref:uncharacterized protein DDB_G0285291-like n=1 Tax=Rhagoletis zephyria TaxID=28612 RepID=UPI00081195B7|nr:PREDICTED: uncharacterized protein DDB_G0285291-like [Rhagoletis zephyria]
MSIPLGLNHGKLAFTKSAADRTRRVRATQRNRRAGYIQLITASNNEICSHNKQQKQNKKQQQQQQQQHQQQQQRNRLCRKLSTGVVRATEKIYK